MDAIIAVQQAPKIALRIKKVLRQELANKISKEFGTIGFWMSRIEPGTFISESALTGLVFIIIDQYVNNEISMDLIKVKQELPDELNPDYMFSMTTTVLLVEIASGKLNAIDYARKELANRGIGLAGIWVGFKDAERQWKLRNNEND